MFLDRFFYVFTISRELNSLALDVFGYRNYVVPNIFLATTMVYQDRDDICLASFCS